MNKVRMEISVDGKTMKIMEHDIDLTHKYAKMYIWEFIEQAVDVLDNINPNDVIAMKDA